MTEREARAERHSALLTRVGGMLRANNVMSPAETHAAFLTLCGLDAAGRDGWVAQRWGQAYFERVEPLLLQLRTLEEIMAGDEAAADGA